MIQPIDAAAVEKQPPPGEKRTLLVVDDEERIRDMLKDALEGKGYSVLTASSAAQACEIYKLYCSRVEHVILDMQMEHPTAGEEAFWRMRDINPQVNACLLTGCADPEAVERMRGLGLSKVWQKPIKIAEILTSLGSERGTDCST